MNERYMDKKRRLPPLNALRIFEVAGQFKSFSKAAENLCITQSAVSKQVKSLEENLGTRLFYRKERGVILTDSGQRLLDTVSRSLGALELGVQEFYSLKNKQMLNVNVPPLLCSHWLLQHVQDFRRRFPEVLLNIDSDEKTVDWGDLLSTDAAVRILPQQLAPSYAELVLPESLVLIAAPEVVAAKPINTVKDVLQHNLIANRSREQIWEHFFAEFELTGQKDQALLSLCCQHAEMTIDAAIQGAGLALVPRWLCHHFLLEGALVNPLGIEFYSDHGYYFLAPTHKRDTYNVRTFYHWLCSQLFSLHASSALGNNAQMDRAIAD